MTDTEEDLIRQRAYEIWESEGFPEGREYFHWEQAVREIGEKSASAGEVSKPAPASFSIVKNEAPLEEMPVEMVAKKRGKSAS
ncbi:DUF2934 domain-containing protein [Pararhizobium antarcticum]|uniref:DUF2934 domain-containing protein n=1 Tax=Pararhizobium antarcticum TaxID=1798805 RepID=A0A657LV34_9HYPH|nr:DUF2934 domain-containing protein [Pararhizobium antarcticum]OJF99080.1 hypothetical protein AX760_13975 [Pararhizobium antarcticum]